MGSLKRQGPRRESNVFKKIHHLEQTVQKSDYKNKQNNSKHKEKYTDTKNPITKLTYSKINTKDNKYAENKKSQRYFMRQTKEI
jgi:hypothetical protein